MQGHSGPESVLSGTSSISLLNCFGGSFLMLASGKGHKWEYLHVLSSSVEYEKTCIREVEMRN